MDVSGVSHPSMCEQQLCPQAPARLLRPEASDALAPAHAALARYRALWLKTGSRIVGGYQRTA